MNHLDPEIAESIPEHLKYLKEPPPPVEISFARDIHTIPHDEFINFPEDVPPSIQEIAPNILHLEQVGRLSIYPDSFRLDASGAPIDNTFKHTIRTCAMARVIAARASQRINQVPNDELRNYLRLTVGMTEHELLMTLWLHDLGESPESGHESVNLAEFIGMLHKNARVDSKQIVPARVWDHVRAAGRLSDESDRRFERKRLERTMGDIDKSGFYYKSYIEPFNRAKDWFRYGGTLTYMKRHVATTAVLAAIIDNSDGNTIFHCRLAEYLKEDGDLSEIGEAPQVYTFEQTETILRLIIEERTQTSFLEPHKDFARQILISVLYEQIRYINEIWTKFGGAPELIAEGLQRMASLFRDIVSMEDWSRGMIVLPE